MPKTILLIWRQPSPFHALVHGRAYFCQERKVYSFRVPLLVISAHTPHGYVDNGIYDFGSIMQFVEKNFGLGRIGPGTWADAYTGDLHSFFSNAQVPARKFVSIKARTLTKAELADTGDADDD